ncbi:MAG: hypothetical protein IPM13_18535 [Phycisphaerales bacterium]|nr:hypothetical protein [Phycisphaerales bacterium]
MKHEIIGTPPEDDADAVRRDFETFVRDLEATPGRRVSVVFGFAWGNEVYASDWLALDLTGSEQDRPPRHARGRARTGPRREPSARRSGSELRVRVDAAEPGGLGAIGSDDLHITLPDLRVERRYCHEDDVHLIADDRSNACLEAQRQKWLDSGWEALPRTRLSDEVRIETLPVGK